MTEQIEDVEFQELPQTQSEFFYHYYATRVSKKTNEIMHFHGILTLVRRIGSPSDYDEIMQLIADENDVPCNSLTICSLNLL